MAAAFLRRSVATAGLAVLATVASPLVGTALAAGFSGTISTDPAASSGTVKATRPTFIGTFTDDLANGSTITVKQGSTVVPCPQTINANVVQCTPSSDLVDGKAYDVSAHGIDKADTAQTATAGPTTFTVDIPSLKSASPADGSVVGSGAGPFAVTYDEAIDTVATTVEIHNPNNNIVPGSLAFSASTLGGPTDTAKFTPDDPLPTGNYVAFWHVEANGNSLAYANDVIHFTVNSTLPSAPPTVSTAGAREVNPANPAAPHHYVNSDNAAAVPFAGTAPPNFRVAVLIYDASNPPHPPLTSMGPNDSIANTGVADCGQAMCPWSLTVNTGNSPERDYRYYVYAYSAAGNNPAAKSAGDPLITKDVTAPADPQQASATMDNAHNTINVTDATPDPSTVAWDVTVADSVGTTVSNLAVPATPGSANNGGSKLLDTNVDVHTLVDGALTVLDYGIDSAGNHTAGDSPSPFSSDTTKESVPLALDTTQSTVSVGGASFSLDDISGQTVQAPSKITMRFNEPLRIDPVMDSSGTHNANPVVLYSPRICLADSTGLCLGDTLELSPDTRSLVWTPKHTPSDGVYTIQQVRGIAATCPDKNQFNASGYTATTCERTDSGNTALTSFTIDDTAPAVNITSITSPITGANINSAGIAGTVSRDASSVQLIIRSSADPGTRHLVTVPVTPPTDSASPTAAWSSFPMPLAGIPDGTLTVTATATDVANNTTAPPAQISTVLNALQFKAASGDSAGTLSWSKPVAGGNGHPITSYSLTVTDVTTNTTAPAVTLAATKTSYTVGHLVNGHTYRVRLLAQDDSLTGPAALGTLLPRAATTLTEKVTATTVTYGQAIRLSGRLTRSSDGAGISPVTLTIQPKYDDGSFGAAMHVRTSTFGFYKTAAFNPAHNATYYVSYAGSSVNSPASAHSARTLVRDLATFTSPSNGARVGSPVTLRGKVSPNLAGKLVAIYQHTSHGNRLLGKASLSRTSTWSFKLTLPHGTFKLFAVIGSTSGNLGNRTGYLTITH